MKQTQASNKLEKNTTRAREPRNEEKKMSLVKNIKRESVRAETTEVWKKTQSIQTCTLCVYIQQRLKEIGRMLNNDTN